MPITLYLYITKKFVINLIFILLIISGIIFIFDTIELFRISHGHDINIFFIFKMALLTNYNHLSIAFPFIILLVTMSTYMQLSRFFELIMIRNCGLSVWQFILPAVILGFIFGIIVIVILNPIGTGLNKQYINLKDKLLNIRKHEVKLLENGLWLRHEIGGNRYIIHASKVDHSNDKLYNVLLIITDVKGTFLKRINSNIAYVRNKQLFLPNAYIIDREYKESKKKNFTLKINFSLQQIQESIASPESISVWELNNFIRELEQSGFSVLRYQSYMYKVLILPIFFVAMILIGVAFSTNLPKFGALKRKQFFGITTGFIIYFLFDVIVALGVSGNIPILLSIVLPLSICLLYGLYLVLHYEY